MSLAQSLARCGRALAASRSPLAFTAARAVSTSGTAAVAEPAADASRDKGWGTTKISDLLKARGPDNGAWLWVARDDLVIDAVHKMHKGNVGSLLVLDPSKMAANGGGVPAASEDTVCGIVTERDYLTKMVVQGKSSLNTKVSEIMTPGKKLVTAEPDDTVVEVMELMVDKNIRHVPVVDAGTMIGMISMRDVVHTMVKEHREEVGHLQEYIQGSY